MIENKVEIDESKNPKGEKVVFSDRVKVRATKANPHMQAGQVYELHPITAKKLIDKGYAEMVKEAK